MDPSPDQATTAASPPPGRDDGGASAPDAASAANVWVPRRLTSGQRVRLVDALVDAFDHGGIERLAGVGLGVPLGEIVSPEKPLPEIAHALAEWAEAQGRLAELDRAAKAHNPGNASLNGWLSRPEGARDSPYRGLFAFQEIDAEVYFGRDAFAEQLASTVARRSVVAVIGPSGSGKSSVVFAGLLPRLRAAGGWVVASFRPGADPFAALAAALVPLLEPAMSETDRLGERGKLAVALRHGGVVLGDVLDRVREKHRATSGVLLVADQFEELFTLTCDDADRRAFLDALLPAFLGARDVRGRSSAVLVPTMRADYLSQALAYPSLVDALQGTDLMLGPMGREELRQAIERPAGLRGVALEAGLTERILDDVGDEPGHLPLLEFALTRLWEEQKHELLTHAAYEAIGEVDGALATHAEEVLSRLDFAPDRIRRIFTQLARPGEGTSDTRRRASREELGEDGWALATQLATEKLVVTDHDEETGLDAVEVAHEALIKEWPRLRGWMDQDRDFRRWQERLRGDLRQWEESGQDTGALLRGAPLDIAEDWQQKRTADLREGEQRFITASVAAREKDASQRRRRVLALVGVSLMAGLFAVFSFVQWQRADDEAQRAEAQARISLIQALSADAMTQVERGDHDLAALLARQAYLFDEMIGRPVRNRVDAALRASLGVPAFRHTLDASAGAVRAVAISGDGQWLAAGGTDGVVRLWNLGHPEAEPDALYSHDGWVNALAFGPDGQWLASAGRDGSVRLWNRTYAAADHQRLQQHMGSVEAVAFSPDGRWLAAAAIDEPVQLWDVSEPEAEAQPLPGNSGSVAAVAFLDDQRLASANKAGVVQVWKLDQPDEGPGRLPEQIGAVTAISISGDGRWLASAAADGSMRLWDLDDPDAAPGDLIDQAGEVTAVAFSVNGQGLAAASQDGTIRLWDFSQTDAAPLSLVGHAGPVNAVAFDANGRRLAAAGPNGSVQLWELSETPATHRRMPGPGGEVTAVAFSADDRLIASAGQRGTVLLWSPSQPEGSPFPLPGSSGWGSAVAMSPDGRWLAVARHDATVQLWDVSDTNAPPHELPGHSGWVIAAAFSPDGQQLASAGQDGAIRLWDLAEIEGEPDILRGATVIALEFRGEERIALASRDGAVRVWNLTQLEVEPLLPENWVGSISVAAFSVDGQWLAAVDQDGLVRLQHLGDQETEPPSLGGQEGSATSVAFSADGQWLASGGEDGTVRLWDVSRPDAESLSFRAHAGAVNAVAVSSDGQWVASAGKDGTVGVWIARPDILAEAVCSTVWRNMSGDEWQQAVGVPQQAPYQSTCPNLPPGKGVAIARATEDVAPSSAVRLLLLRDGTAAVLTTLVARSWAARHW